MRLNKLPFKIIAGALLLFAVFDVFQGKLGIKIDGITVTIIGFAILVFLLPELTSFSKFKYGDIEIEFQKNVDNLEKLVTAEESVDKPDYKSKVSDKGWEQYYKEYNDILATNSTGLEKIMRASQLIEYMIAQAAKDFGLADKVDLRSSTSIVNELRKNGLISEEELLLFREFRTLRNKIIHGDVRLLSDSMTTRILDLLGRMVRIFG